MTPTRDPETERLEAMAEHIARRDRLPIEQARQILRGLGPGDLTMLELDTRAARPSGHTFDYDPYARG